MNIFCAIQQTNITLIPKAEFYNSIRYILSGYKLILYYIIS